MFIDSQGRLLLLFTHEVLAEMNRFPNTAGRWIVSTLDDVASFRNLSQVWISDSTPFPMYAYTLANACLVSCFHLSSKSLEL